MKTITKFIPLLTIFLLILSCSGADSYRGDWKAVDGKGNQLELHFEKKEMTITANGEESKKWAYTQNAISIENGVKSYGINLKNGLSYTITFPIKGNTEKAVITDQNEKLVYIIGRSQYYNYDDVFGLN